MSTLQKQEGYCHRLKTVPGTNTFKKVKCDKGRPICHQCVTAKAECVYVERRQRPRLAQQRVAVTSLSKRLELLERQIVNGGHRSESEPEIHQTPATSVSATAPDSAEREPLTGSSLSPEDQVSDNGKDSWVYQMASNTQRQFQTQATPASTPTPQIDTDMSALSDALEDLGRLKPRTDLIRGKASLEIQSEEARQCLEGNHRSTVTILDSHLT